MVVQNIDKGKYPPATYSVYAPQIVSALGLKRFGNEYKGSCPNCGGTDRFWISDYQGEVKVNCRKCGDWKAIIEALRGLNVYPTKDETVVNFPEIEEVHPYLTRKKIKQHNAEVDEGDLKIQIINSKGQIQGTQFIDENGKKKFNHGLQYKGCFSVVNGPITDFAYISEGWATACSVTEATGKPCVFALNASNITNVVEELKAVKPNAKLIIAGDNDEAGIKACEKAFSDHGVESIMPHGEGLDWNDVWIARGAEYTRKALEPKNVLDEVIFPDQAVAQIAKTYLVKGWLTENTISAVFGPSNVGKSFFALDLSWHIAANEMWLNSRVQGGSVVYLATEGGNSFQNRLVALRQQYQDHTNVKLAIRPSPINLFNAEEDIEKVEAIIREISKSHGQCKMLVIDTLSRATQGQMDENSNSEAAKFIMQLDGIRERTGVHIMLIAHSGKDTSKGLRGASSIRAAIDTEIELSFDEDTRIRTAIATKQRDMETGEMLNFILEVVHLGEDEDGDPVTTCVIREATEDEINEVAKPRIKGKNQKLFKQVFTQLRGEGIGAPNPSGAGWPDNAKFWCISENTLQEHFIGKLVGVKKPQQTYKQTFDAMLDNGHIQVNEGKIWFCGNDGKTSDKEKSEPF